MENILPCTAVSEGLTSSLSVMAPPALLYHKQSEDISSSEEDSGRKIIYYHKGPAPLWIDQCPVQLAWYMIINDWIICYFELEKLFVMV